MKIKEIFKYSNALSFQSDNNMLLILLTIMVFAFVILRISLFLILHSFNLDAGFYLMEARLFSSSFDIYGNMPSHYTPLGAMILSIPYFLLDDPPYVVFLIVQYTFITLSGFVFYKILRSINISRTISVFYSSLTILTIFNMEGDAIILEPYVLFFILLSIYSILSGKKFRYFFVGVYVFLAFWSKQYALFIFPPIIILLIIESNNKDKNFNNLWRNLLYLSFGLSISLIISVIFLLATSIFPLDKIFSIYAGTYNTNDTVATGFGYSYMALIRRIAKIMFFNLPFLLIPLSQLSKGLISKDYSLLKNSAAIFFLCGFVFSLSQLLFGYYDHYFILIIPFSLLLTALIVNDYDKSLKRKYLGNIYFFSFLIPVIISGYLFGKNLISMDSVRKNQETISITAKEINRIVVPYSPAIIIGERELNYLCRVNSPNKLRLVPGGDGGYKHETILKNIISNGYLIIKNDSLNNYLTDLKKYPFRKIGEADSYTIFQKLND